MEIRSARLDDATALGRIMVEAWLSAHRGQVPEEAWLKRVAEWTPEVSAAAWSRLLDDLAASDDPRTVLLVAEEESGEPVGLCLASEDESDPSGATAEVDALYVVPAHHRRGIGRLLLGVMATHLLSVGFTALHIGVLTANSPARQFYEAMGGREVGHRTFDEDGVPLPGTVYAWSDLRFIG